MSSNRATTRSLKVRFPRRRVLLSLLSLQYAVNAAAAVEGWWCGAAAVAAVSRVAVICSDIC